VRDSNPPSPLQAGRIVTLDFIRGVAVLGILFANILAFSEPLHAYYWPIALQHPMSRTDEALWLAQYVLIDGKMRGLFSLLFGAGMILFVERQGPRLQLRRLFWLALFGLAHYFLLFRGDILFTYAFCGLFALAAVRLDGLRLLMLGLALYVLGGLWTSVLYAPQLQLEAAVLGNCPTNVECVLTSEDRTYWSAVNAQLAEARAESEVMRGGFAGIVAYNWQEHGWEAVDGAVLALLETLPLMLIGMGLLRVGLFHDAPPSRRLLAWGLGGIALGAALTLPLALWVAGAGHPFYRSGFAFLGPAQLARLPMILGLAACLVWLAPRAGGGWLGDRLVAAGRMAFSNYLGMSLVMAFLFQGWGLARFGTPDRLELLEPVLGGWILMLVWSKPWLDRFRYGPLEWLWRCLAYGRLFPLRR
jgi:uncharacterized protein